MGKSLSAEMGVEGGGIGGHLPHRFSLSDVSGPWRRRKGWGGGNLPPYSKAGRVMDGSYFRGVHQVALLPQPRSPELFITPGASPAPGLWALLLGELWWKMQIPGLRDSDAAV